MTSRERVQAALDRRQPDRTPFAWGFGLTGAMTQVWEPWLAQRGVVWSRFYDAVSDIVCYEPDYIGPAMQPGQPVYVGIWGIETRSASYGAGAYEEFVGHPLAGLEDPADLARIRWPSPDGFDYASLPRQIAARDPGRVKAVQLSGMTAGNPFEIYCWMTGMEEAMINLVTHPDLVTAALDRICAYFEAKLDRCAEVLGEHVDLLHYGDDLAGQQGLLFSREAYCDVIQPFHRRLVAHGRQRLPRAKAMLHTDGAVFDILPDVIDAGFDVLEAVQTDAAGMDAERLKTAYGPRLVFHGGVPVQSLLPHGDAAAVRRECRRLCDVLGRGGGYIAAPTHAIQAGTPPENIWAMLEAVVGEDALLDAIRL